MLIDTSLNFLSIEIPFGFHIKYLLIIMSTSDSAGTSGAQVLTPKVPQTPAGGTCRWGYVDVHLSKSVMTKKIHRYYWGYSWIFHI